MMVAVTISMQPSRLRLICTASCDARLPTAPHASTAVTTHGRDDGRYRLVDFGPRFTSLRFQSFMLPIGFHAGFAHTSLPAGRISVLARTRPTATPA